MSAKTYSRPRYFLLLGALFFMSAQLRAAEEVSFDGSVLSIPVVQVGQQYYRIELTLLSSSEFTELQLSAGEEIFDVDTTNASTFTDSELYLPSLTVGESTYFGRFSLISQDPPVFRLVEADLVTNPSNSVTSLKAVTGEIHVNSFLDYDQSRPLVAMADDASFVVLYLSEGQLGQVNTVDLYARLFNSDGSPKGAEFPVTNLSASSETYREDHYDLSMAADGTFVVAWSGAGENDRAVYASIYDADGSLFAGNILVDDETTIDDNYNVSAGMDDQGNFSVAYDFGFGTTQGAKLRLFDDDGNPRGEALWITEDAQALKIDLGMNADGEMIVVWHEGLEQSDVFMRRVNAMGDLLGEFKLMINTEDEGSQNSARAVIADDGGAAIVWQSDQSASPGVYLQVIDSTGEAFGENRLVAAEQGFDHTPSVSGSEEGSLVVTWAGFGPEGFVASTAVDIWAQLYSVTGLAQGDPVKINVFDADNQQDAHVAVEDNNAQLVIAWTDFLQEDANDKGDGVYARVMSLELTDSSAISR